jgi:hypothetical protein
MHPIDPVDAEKWNQDGWGIFSTVQAFDGPRRKENLTKIRAWAVDIDAGTKREQMVRIERTPLVPSSIVETKNGYHVYFYAEDGVRPQYYRALVDRMVAFFKGDRNATDVARVLRVPGFYHLKDPADPFLVRHVHGPDKDVVYSERQMWNAFPASWEEKKKRLMHNRSRSQAPGTADDFWEAVYNLDCIDALEKLSGTGYVGGERFSFRSVGGGRRHNIIVDGKGTSCWIDEDGRIGSKDKGGPTVVQWLHWYGTPIRECVRIVKEMYPELEQR